MKKKSSKLMKSIMGTVRGLHRAGVMDDAKLREYEELARDKEKQAERARKREESKTH